MVLHFVFDVVWFALPLFASPSVPDQVMVILLASAPLWLVLAKWALASRSPGSKVPLLPPLPDCVIPLRGTRGHS
jgi:hypothetical protein